MFMLFVAYLVGRVREREEDVAMQLRGHFLTALKIIVLITQFVPGLSGRGSKILAY